MACDLPFTLLFESLPELPNLSCFEKYEWISTEQFIADIHTHILSACNDSGDRFKEWNKLGVGCLQLFAQANFYGPPLRVLDVNCTVLKVLFERLSSEEQESFAAKVLLKDPESCDTVFNHRCSFPVLLAVAKLVLVDCQDTILSRRFDCFVTMWLSLRVLFMLQKVLVEKSASLQRQINELIKQMCSAIEDPDLTNRSMAGLFYAESVYMLLECFDVKSAEEASLKALEISGLKLTFTGALGKRTRFQQTELAQLTAFIPQNTTSDDSSTVDSQSVSKVVKDKKQLPIDLSLQDEVLLERISFSGDALLPDRELTTAEQCLLLAHVNATKRCFANDILLQEQLAVLISKLLSHPKAWCIQASALCLRSQMESDESRKIERTMLQMQELVDQFERPDPPGPLRAQWFYSSNLPTIWNLQKALCELLRKLGCITEALTVYDKLGMYEEVVECYKLLGKKQQAEHLIRRLLSEAENSGKKPNHRLLVLLGEITLNADYFEQAWEISGKRSAKAKYALGMHYFVRKEYATACEAFERSLEILPLQRDAWFALGFSAMKCENYELAAKAYHRCTSIEPDNFEAWNNLAASYIHLKQKDRAHKTLKEAIRNNFDNWRVWENFLLVSVDIGIFSDAVDACHRLVDLKEKWSDIEVLDIICNQILAQTNAQEVSAVKCKAALLKLFGRLSSKGSNDPEFWRVYAKLSCPVVESNNAEFDAWDRHLRLLQRASHCATQKTDWEMELTSREKTVEAVLEYAKAAHRLCLMEVGSNNSASKAFLSSARLSLNAVKSKLNSLVNSIVDPVQCDNLALNIRKMNEMLTDIEGNL